ncbi:hypothetical protein RhiirA1_484516 [Rhizophagus irregularis]|uniref:Uncharacterized protein n=1 Tax=Rhizophagus irregularis TaxID=588596 RepID=A0A2N0QJ94_9GLOM|nr:hypothetical protein RhiirA1_484516 [Rhizophagus irregularis]
MREAEKEKERKGKKMKRKEKEKGKERKEWKIDEGSEKANEGKVKKSLKFKNLKLNKVLPF